MASQPSIIEAHALSHPGRYRARHDPARPRSCPLARGALGVPLARRPDARMIASALRPLMSALRLRSAQRRLNRRQVIKLLAEANRRPNLRRLTRQPAR